VVSGLAILVAVTIAVSLTFPGLPPGFILPGFTLATLIASFIVSRAIMLAEA
jgi:hypothetical protein